MKSQIKEKMINQRRLITEKKSPMYIYLVEESHLIPIKVETRREKKSVIFLKTP